MATTKLVLNRQTDKELTGATITAPIGIIKGDIPGLVGDLSAINDTLSDVYLNLSTLSAADAAEALRATAAESAESAARSAADAQEVLRATAAEDVLTANIATEKGRVDAILLAVDADKDSFAEIAALINSVDTSNDETFAGYVLSNNAAVAAEAATRSAADIAETLRATAAELVLTENLTSEQNARIADVEAEETRALAAELSLTDALSAEHVARIAHVNQEVARAQAAELVLTENLTSEQNARVAYVDAESTRALSAEAAESAARIAADGVLQANINAEIDARSAGDIALVSAYTSADASLTSDITVAYTAADSALTAAYIAADTTLQSNINVEKGRVDAILLASDADKDTFAEIAALINSVDTTNTESFAGYVLSNNAAVAAEAATRSAADIAETLRATAAEDAEAATRGAADIAETLRATAAEALLSGRITTEVSRAIDDVDAEEARGLAAEALLSGRITSEVADRTTADSAITSAYIAADAATLASANAYSDGISQGLDIKQSVRVASTTFISSLSGLQTIDAVALVAGNRILVKNQTIANANGIYVVSEGAWTRSTDADTTAKVTAGLFTFIEEGAINSDQGWVLQSNQPIVLGTTSLVFVQFSSAGVVGALNGLTKTGNNIGLGGTLTGGTTSLLGMADPTLYLGTSGSKLLTLSANVSNHYVNASYIANVSTGSLSNTASGGFTNTSMGGHLNNSATVGNINLTALAGNLGHNSTGMTITTSNGTGAVYGSDYSAGFVDNSLVSKLFVTNKIAAEALLARAAEADLQANVDGNTANINAILLAATASTDSFAEIVTLINSVDTSNDETFAGYVLSNNAAVAAEAATRSAADIAEALRATAAEAAEAATRGAADIAETLRATAAEDATTLALTAEQVRASAAEDLLSGRITTEVARATAAEAGLDGRIVNIISNIDVSAIDSFSETVSKVNTAFSSTSSSLSANTISNRPSMKGFNEAPNAERVLFTSSVVLDTQIVFLNGLMQVSGAGNDYIAVANPMTGVLQVTFATAPALADKVNIYGVTSGIAIPAPSVVAVGAIGAIGG